MNFKNAKAAAHYSWNMINGKCDPHGIKDEWISEFMKGYESY